MDTYTLQKYLGTSYHHINYHHHRLYEEELFPEDHWHYLKVRGDNQHWQLVFEALDYALKLKDYYIDNLIYPKKDRFAKKDVMFFFEKFHAFLKENLNK